MKNLIAKKNLIQQKVKYMKRKIKRIQAVCIYMMLLLLLLLPQTAMAKNTEKSKTTFPVQVIHKTGDDKENFVIVIMGDGYTAGQQDQFLEDATQKARGMLTWSPYSRSCCERTARRKLKRGIWDVSIDQLVDL